MGIAADDQKLEPGNVITLFEVDGTTFVQTYCIFTTTLFRIPKKKLSPLAAMRKS
ncbi:phage minor tail protein L [Klebsiella variicola]|nr:phage minor tail protein L [Klebsiella variicola]